MKIVLNKCYGGFGLSKEALQLAIERNYTDLLEPGEEGESFSWSHYINGITFKYTSSSVADRTNPHLIDLIETLGSKEASGEHSRLVIIDVPDGISGEIHDYDGVETFRETHRSW